MEIHYRTDKERMIDPAELNGFAVTQEASRLARPLAHRKAYDLAKFHGTCLAGWDEEKRCVTYVDPQKYSFEDMCTGKYKNDPSIYTPPSYITSAASPVQ